MNDDHGRHFAAVDLLVLAEEEKEGEFGGGGDEVTRTGRTGTYEGRWSISATARYLVSLAPGP
jgi:hypothetical protein